MYIINIGKQVGCIVIDAQYFLTSAVRASRVESFFKIIRNYKLILVYYHIFLNACSFFSLSSLVYVKLSVHAIINNEKVIDFLDPNELALKA
jgi:hypothetical protein